MKTLLIANRGEIAVRIIHAAAELGIRSVAVFSKDDVAALHTRRADLSVPLGGSGPAAYLDIEQLVRIARQYDCDALHPGYGFLSENPALARVCSEAGVTFVGPRAETLALLGNKIEARRLAERYGVPVLRGSAAAVSIAEAREFFASLGRTAAMVIKAVAGGGGRGMRLVRAETEIDAAFARCESEARQAFGNGDLYVEEYMPLARHIEVQIVGDGTRVSHLGERECSIQRQHQKLIEIAPCPSLSPLLRAHLAADAVRIAEAARYLNVGTFEFLVEAPAGDHARYAFIEANPRLQVEHTITEEVWGVDVVCVQLHLASGRALADLGLLQTEIGGPRGHAIQLRINAETYTPDGTARPTSGTVKTLALPSGHGVRTDTGAHVGYETNPHFDSLLAKLIVHSSSPRFADTVARATRALSELELEGVRTNIPFLRALLQHPSFILNRIHTRFLEDHMSELAVEPPPGSSPASGGGKEGAAGASIDPVDPLAVLSYGKSPTATPTSTESPVPVPPYDTPAGAVALPAPMQGTIISIDVLAGDLVHKGQPLFIMNAMKMEHVIYAPVGGLVHSIAVREGDTVVEGAPLAFIEERDTESIDRATAHVVDLDVARADLAEVQQRHALTLDGARPDAVARRHQLAQRTARENVDDLCDPGTFIEYGALAIAAQRQRRTKEDLIARTPADGLVAGIGRVNGELFDDQRAQCAVLSYDYTVLAGTQGFLNHRKKDRMFELIERLRIPVVFFTEGGGGRPGDTDAPGVAGLDCMAFHLFGSLSGLVPLIGINSGRCFAGNAALLGCCDVIIATANSNIGMGGPAMIEGGGLGVFRPDEVGPMRVQVPNGVADIPVDDEAAAVRVAKQYVSYFQGPLTRWETADQRQLRAIIPENRLRVYDIRTVIDVLADAGSVLELRRHFGSGMVTALIRIDGRPLGVVANNPMHLSGAIDSAAADKAARFMQLCDAFDLPILFLCDTPGIMVGPEVEKTALVRHCARMFVVGASLTVPFMTIVLRKSYGLGAQAMAGGSHKAPLFTVAWPTGEFGGMGLEGAVKLGFRKELEAVTDPAQRKALFEHMVARAYEHGKALNTATHFEIDDVIDPADSRRWIANALRSAPPPPPRTGKKRPCVDTW